MQSVETALCSYCALPCSPVSKLNISDFMEFPAFYKTYLEKFPSRNTTFDFCKQSIFCDRENCIWYQHQIWKRDCRASSGESDSSTDSSLYKKFRRMRLGSFSQQPFIDTPDRLDILTEYILQKKWKCVRAMISTYPEVVNEKDVKGQLPLEKAIVAGAPCDIITQILSLFPLIVHDSEEYSFLNAAIRTHASNEVLRVLMQAFPGHTLQSWFKNCLPTHVAITLKSSFETVQILLDQYPECANQLSPQGELPIHLAIEYRASIDTILLLLRAHPEGARRKNKNDVLPLHLSIHVKSDVRVIAALLDSYMIATKCKDRDGNIPLFTALLHHANVGVIRLLLEADPASLEERNLDFDLAIHVAIKSECCFEIVKLLIDERPSCVSVANCDGDLPIHTACSIGSSLELIRYLCDTFPEGARVCNYGDNLPLHLAVSSGASIEVVDMLLRLHIAGAAHKNSMDKVPLLLAIEARAEAEVVAALLKANPAEAGQRDHKDALPLHNAVSKNVPVNVFWTLFDVCPGAIKEADFSGDLPLHKAAMGHCSLNLLRAVIKAYPEGLETKNKQGDLPAHVAARSKSPVEIVSEIISRCPGCANQRNKYNHIPLFCGLKARREFDVVCVLVACNPALVSDLCFDYSVPSVYNYHLQTHDLLFFVNRMLRPALEISFLRVHICGASKAGKSSLKLGLQRCLGKSFLTVFMEANSSSNGKSAYVGIEKQDCSACCLTQSATYLEDKKWLFMDYSGERELLSVCSSFLSLSDSVFIVVVPLWDIVCNKLVSFDQAIADCRFWLRLLNSVARKGSKCYIVRNFKRLGYAADRAYCKRIKDAIKQLISDFKCGNCNNLELEHALISAADFNSKMHAFLSFNKLLTDNLRFHPERFIYCEAIKLFAVSKLTLPKAARKTDLFTIFFLPLVRILCTEHKLNLDVNYVERDSYLNNAYRSVFYCALDYFAVLGEILVVEGVGDGWVVTDQNWLMGDVLGGLHRHKTSDEVQFIDGEHCSCSYVLTAQDIESRCHGSTYFNGDIYLLPKLLEFLGYCVVLRNREGSDIRILYRIDCTGNPDSSTLNMYCFPCFCVATMPLERRFISSKAWHHLHTRRYKLKAPNYQMFPPGYFPSLFVQICQAVSYLCCGIVQVWADGLEIRCEDSGKETACIKVAIMQDETMFEIEIGYGETAEFHSLVDAIYDLVTHPKGRRACWEHVLIEDDNAGIICKRVKGVECPEEPQVDNEILRHAGYKRSTIFCETNAEENNEVSSFGNRSRSVVSESPKFLDTCGVLDISLDDDTAMNLLLPPFGHPSIALAKERLHDLSAKLFTPVPAAEDKDSVDELMNECRRHFRKCQLAAKKNVVVFGDIAKECHQLSADGFLTTISTNHDDSDMEDFSAALDCVEVLNLDRRRGLPIAGQRATSLAELYYHAYSIVGEFSLFVRNLTSATGESPVPGNENHGSLTDSPVHIARPLKHLLQCCEDMYFEAQDDSCTAESRPDSITNPEEEDLTDEFGGRACKVLALQWDVVAGVIVVRTMEQLSAILRKLSQSSDIIQILSVKNKVSNLFVCFSKLCFLNAYF